MEVGLGLTTPLLAQTCVYDWTQDYEQLTRLTDQFNATTGDGDSLTIPTLGSTLSGEKETWYVPRRESSGCPTGTAGFYREYNSSLQDHRDTPTPGDLSGYLSDINLGCPWTSSSARQGLTSIRRYFKSSTNDHKTWLSTAPAGYTLDANFSSGLTARYGYQRFGNELSRGDVLILLCQTGFFSRSSPGVVKAGAWDRSTSLMMTTLLGTRRVGCRRLPGGAER